MALAAGLETPLGRMLAVATHLGLIRGRNIQRLRRHWTDAYHQARPDTVSSTHVRASARGRSVGRVIDYVFIRQPPAQHWRVEQADHVSSPGLPHSDHLAVLARLIPDDLRPRDGAADRRGIPPLR
jgi:hypothetical protein